MAESKLGVAVVGYGYWGPNLVRNFTLNADAEVRWVCDQDATRLELARSQHPGIGITANLNEVLGDNGVDIVAVATPVSTHFEIARQALESGRHVFIEKPMTHTTEQSERLIELSEAKGLVVMVDHTFIYTGAVRKIKEIVSSGQLGNILYFDSVRVNLGLFQNDVNVVWDLAPHDLSIMDHIIGLKPRAVQSVGVAHARPGMENIGYITVFFHDNVIGHFHVNWLAPVKVRLILIGGDRKMLVFDDMEPSEKVKIYDKGITVDSDDREGKYQSLVRYRMGDMFAPYIDNTEALKLEVAHLVECINDRKKPITDGKTGLNVVRILEAAERSIRSGGEIISFES